MPSTYIDLTYWQVGIAALLILVNGLISVLLRLELERQLFVGAVRMTFQLLAVGLVLHWVFALSQWYLVLALMLVMTTVAAIAAVDRVRHRYRGIFLASIFSVWASSWFVTAVALVLVIQVKPWYTPQYAIPLIGMILGNTLNGIALGIDRFTGDLGSRRGHVETLLALGATRWEAAQRLVSEAVRTGMVPIVNLMMVAGIVSLPGMMTGQLLAGVEPVAAVKYQIVIMFLIAAGTGLGTVGGVLITFRHLFNRDHQFLHKDLQV